MPRASAAHLALVLVTAACSGQPSNGAFDASDQVSASLAGTHRPLRADEKDILDAQGFVLGEASVTPSFHLGYTALFKSHTPVYFSADAVLHAVHRSIDEVMMRIEEAALARELAVYLDETRRGLERHSGDDDARADVDLYLAVAQTLLSGEGATPRAGAQPAQIKALVGAVEKAAGPVSVKLFGRDMLVDTSMMKPRGHYDSSDVLKRYFRAMMWLGRTELRIAKMTGEGWKVNRRALRAAMLFDEVRTDRSRLAWRRLDKAAGTLVGPADDMSYPGLAKGLATLRTGDVAVDALDDRVIGEAFAPHAERRIRGQLLKPEERIIAFVPLSQRYIFGSHVFTEVTYGNLPVKRMMPSPLDVGAAVFKNPAARSLLTPELDKWGYAATLDSITQRGDEAGPDLWQTSVAHLWLSALRALSADDDDLPSPMRTPAWQKRMLNTQLASWAELRHDTLLYAKQSFTAMAICGFPDAYVEPYPAFFGAIEKLSIMGASLTDELDFGKRPALGKRIKKYFRTLKENAARLRRIALAERRREPLGSEHLDYLNRAVSVDGRSAGCTIQYEPKGWYADLYFDRDDVMWHEPIVADVHTQPTDEIGTMVGKVLHVATARPRLFQVVVETCDGPRAYRGFVATYHEHITSDFERLTDDEWRQMLTKRPPPQVPWLSTIATTD